MRRSRRVSDYFVQQVVVQPQSSQKHTPVAQQSQPVAQHGQQLAAAADEQLEHFEQSAVAAFVQQVVVQQQSSQTHTPVVQQSHPGAQHGQQLEADLEAVKPPTRLVKRTKPITKAIKGRRDMGISS